jgi:DNA polymerase-3 subunit delta
LERRPAAPVYVFLGPEPYYRDRCRSALLRRLLPEPEQREQGFLRHDLDETALAAVIDDACSFSLFAPERVIWVSTAEAVLPKGRKAADETAGDAAGEMLASYVGNPAPGTTVVFDCSRYDFSGEDKAKMERVRKFYSAIRDVVEFPHLTPAEARNLATDLARQRGVKIGGAEIQLLAEVTGNSAPAIATEIEKLALYAEGRAITEADIAQLVPNARAESIFALVNALARNDRSASLEILDTLVKEGEYLPLAISFLATQFRQALTAAEAGLRGSSQIMGYFSKMGVAMWPSRADQVAQTMQAFSPAQLRGALTLVAAADRDLRDTRPDDRIVMEQFVLALSSGSVG